MILSLLKIIVFIVVVIFFVVLCQFPNQVESHHIRGIPEDTGDYEPYPCDCEDEDFGGGGQRIEDHEGPCDCGYGPALDEQRDEDDEGCPRCRPPPLLTGLIMDTHELSCSDCPNKNLRCAGNLEKCCLPNGLCGYPDPCVPSQCRAMGSTWLEVHGVPVVSFSFTRIRHGDMILKCDTESNSLMCCKDASYCVKLPEILVDKDAMNTLFGTICAADGRTVLQVYANLTETILLWAFGRERDGLYFGDIVGEVITKLLGRTPNLPFY